MKELLKITVFVISIISVLPSGAIEYPEDYVDHGSLISLNLINDKSMEIAVNYPNLDRKNKGSSDCFVVMTSEIPAEPAGFAKLAYDLVVAEGFEFLGGHPTGRARHLPTEFHRMGNNLVAVKKLDNVPLYYVTGFQISMPGHAYQTVAQSLRNYFPTQPNMQVYVQFFRTCGSLFPNDPIPPF